VKQTEQHLWQLFKAIDKDRNGQLDKEELRSAFKNSGLEIGGERLERFFREVDRNHDGRITFDEWR
jgi:solute carrier family 25 phosphate transporter 23/24/25/41